MIMSEVDPEYILQSLPPDLRRKLREMIAPQFEATTITYVRGGGETKQDVSERVEALEKLVKESRLSELPKVIEFVDDMRNCLFSVEREIELRETPIEEAVNKVKEYVRAHPGCKTSDIVVALSIAPEIVVQALSILEKQDEIEGKDIER